MKQIIHIADFYASEIRGGGELVDEIVVSSLVNRGYSVTRIKSKNVTEKFIKENADKLFIVSNFVMLPGMCINMLKSCDYVIYEHDHKYLKTRNPASYPDYLAPEDQIINYDFYKNANMILCQSNFHKSILQKNLKLKLHLKVEVYVNG